MKPLLAVALIASSLVGSGPAGGARAAEPITFHAKTSGDLAELCAPNPKEPAADAKINYCHGFAQATVDLELQHAGGKKPFCFPSPPPTRSATLGEFASWVRSLPEHRTLSATDGLMQFLGVRYPCK
jgi:Rap1a immunity proteins